MTPVGAKVRLSREDGPVAIDSKTIVFVHGAWMTPGWEGVAGMVLDWIKGA